MTTINKSKATIFNRSLTSIFIVICFLLSLIQSQEAYAEMKKVSGTSKAIVRLAETQIAVADITQKGSLEVFRSVLSSADPDWNDARFFYIRYDEPTKEWGKKGYGVITHPGGDQTFIKFVIRELSAAGSAATGEWEGFFIGGTGKFKDIKARWLLKWKFTTTEGRLDEWKVEYF
jgi:hypothetical protein